MPNSARTCLVNDTIAIPVFQSWTNATVPMIATPKTAAPVLDNAALWANEETNSLYMWGGQGPWGNCSKEKDLWRFDANGNGQGNWTIQEPSNMDVFVSFSRTQQAAATTCNGVGFYLGGFGTDWSDPEVYGPGEIGVPVPGMLTYNMTSMVWANESTVPPDLANPENSNQASGGVNAYGIFISGSITCLPDFGSQGQGLVLALGGIVNKPQDGYNATEPKLLGFNSVSLWDIGTRTWHSQTTTGDVPSARVHTCVVSAQEAKRNDASFDIFLFGGSNPNSGDGFEDVYVLSIPGFVWFRVSTASAGGPRMGHECVLAGNRQMIVVGGINPELDIVAAHRDVDPWTNGIGVFDISTLSWNSKFDAQAEPYESPDVIKRWYDAG